MVRQLSLTSGLVEQLGELSHFAGEDEEAHELIGAMGNLFGFFKASIEEVLEK
jgi:Asp-tRNA(Asn)/Glu-tRNA(Gln) amidotransferase C subunit